MKKYFLPVTNYLYTAITVSVLDCARGIHDISSFRSMWGRIRVEINVYFWIVGRCIIGKSILCGGLSLFIGRPPGRIDHVFYPSMAIDRFRIGNRYYGSKYQLPKQPSNKSEFFVNVATLQLSSY